MVFMAQPLMRIGELAARSHVSADLLRAWERRYHIPAPQRTGGGFRLYTAEDLARVIAMRDLVRAGVPASEAARRVIEDATEPTPPPADTGLGELRLALAENLRSLDDSAAQKTLDALLSTYAVETIVTNVLLPVLRDLGADWAEGGASIAQEHFAVNVLRGRVLSLARAWDDGAGPRALLACPPGEFHDVSLAMFGVLMRRKGWRVTFLGADTPMATLASAVAAVIPDLVVLFSPIAGRFEEMEDELRALRQLAPVALCGAAATPESALRTGCRNLDGDPAAVATLLSAEARPFWGWQPGAPRPTR